MLIGNKEFDTDHHTYIMGILNVTPDSFSDGGKFNSLDRALAHVQQMIEEGADIIDIGGESTRPGYQKISEQEEIDRAVPVIEAVRKRFDIPISLDTYKSAVAREGLAAGADLINDIWGLKYDSQMADVIAESKAVCCLMHNRETARYKRFMPELLDDMKESLAKAQKAGISKEKIILDPGIGFGKTYEQNLTALNHLEELKGLGFPVLLGVSRKSVIGLTLDVPAGDRLAGTLAATVLGVLKGCAFVRVHDVKENLHAVKMTEAILRG
ncbi:Dihydropteroate synthase [uncultured Roseburia sp.]|uniref:Dihydropteroate synthase n=1 Tax=Brotonthovivens ammoniilytica TaxID=2981725 RepID=A0ABT2TH26_9FIRM|nr:dihydropteroate synthase [Brotonthovivens ammoniilytica]MCU6760889.1 dihydropteroate synthase [Brotonthovivens ammoniilytica]SCI12368.1 Dihydropteroate synthase [uncultured Roseburia sp.]